MKLPESILLELQQLRDEFTENVVKIGRINVDISFYERDIRELKNELELLYSQSREISKKEKNINDRIISEFGEGNLDIETGEYTKK